MARPTTIEPVDSELDGPSVFVEALVFGCRIGDWIASPEDNRRAVPLRHAAIFEQLGSARIVAPLDDRGQKFVKKINGGDIHASY